MVSNLAISLRLSTITVALAITAGSVLREATAQDEAGVQLEPPPSEQNLLLPQVRERRARIESELVRLGGRHAWAGHYHHGDGLGTNVTAVLAPESGAAMSWLGCLGLYGENEGGIALAEDGRIDLHYRLANDPDDFARFAESLYPVQWGERRYLLAPDELIEFVNALHHGQEPRTVRHGRFLLREGDESRPVAGLPALPGSVADLIRARPLQLMVRAARMTGQVDDGAACRRTWRLELDRAPADGVFVGARLEVVEPDNVIGWPTVADRTLDGWVAEIVFHDYDGDCRAIREQPAAGWILGTGAYAEGGAEEVVAGAPGRASAAR